MPTQYDVANEPRTRSLMRSWSGRALPGSAAAITMAKAGLQVVAAREGREAGLQERDGRHPLPPLPRGDRRRRLEGGAARAADHRGAALDHDPEAAIGIDYKNFRNREHPYSYSSPGEVRRLVRRAGREGGRVRRHGDRRRKADRARRARSSGSATGRGDDRLRGRGDRLRGHRPRHAAAREHADRRQAARRKLRPNEVAMAVKEIMAARPGA